MKIKKLTGSALLTALALALFVLEAQIPLPVPVPGIKLGLANIVTVLAVFLFGWRWALGILLTRILLGSFYTGFSQLPFSLAGGLLSLAAVLAVKRFLRPGQIWVAGALGGMFHNLGQMAVAVVVTGTAAVLYYLPLLLAAGLLTGLFTGLCAQFTAKRLHGYLHKSPDDARTRAHPEK
jgi:heptaprenyl diphosphate synthase